MKDANNKYRTPGIGKGNKQIKEARKKPIILMKREKEIKDYYVSKTK